jgi:hypothetical protein
MFYRLPHWLLGNHAGAWPHFGDEELEGWRTNLSRLLSIQAGTSDCQFTFFPPPHGDSIADFVPANLASWMFIRHSSIILLQRICTCSSLCLQVCFLSNIYTSHFFLSATSQNHFLRVTVPSHSTTSSGKVPIQQAWSPEFKFQNCQNRPLQARGGAYL